MKSILGLIGGEGVMLRRFLLLSAALVAVTFAAAHGVIALITLVTPDQVGRISATTAQGTRQYTVTRSVLDDGLQTGSIPRPAGRPADPCRD
ncbi:hypothetical protein [Rhabdaerophilum calidifontis]|uniref:hypothetical protein n=1 Tax=Rhabdaerophilum calidifontis TaxID=2604328 RepID=UPI0012386A27|nr:hypothetical protein [Rhabdaerophilum calidifontis]